MPNEYNEIFPSSDQKIKEAPEDLQAAFKPFAKKEHGHAVIFQPHEKYLLVVHGSDYGIYRDFYTNYPTKDQPINFKREAELKIEPMEGFEKGFELTHFGEETERDIIKREQTQIKNHQSVLSLTVDKDKREKYANISWDKDTKKVYFLQIMVGEDNTPNPKNLMDSTTKDVVERLEAGEEVEIMRKNEKFTLALDGGIVEVKIFIEGKQTIQISFPFYPDMEPIEELVDQETRDNPATADPQLDRNWRYVNIEQVVGFRWIDTEKREVKRLSPKEIIEKYDL